MKYKITNVKTAHKGECSLFQCEVLNFAAKSLYHISYRICNHSQGWKLLFINVTIIK